MGWEELFYSYVTKHPLLFIYFNKQDSISILRSRHSVNHFSFTRKHDEFYNLKAPAPCIFYLEVKGELNSFIGIARSKRAVSTIDSAIKITDAVNIVPSSPEKLGDIISNPRFKALFKQRSEKRTTLMTPKLGVEIISCLLSVGDNRQAIESICQKITGFEYLPNAAKMQMDAIRLAMVTFGISKTESPIFVETIQDSDSTLRYLSNPRILEDNVIAHDARSIPGFNLIESDFTGRAIFERGNERLEVITANRTDLERTFGVDLIYINSTRKNVVMVQYKMLEEEETDGNKDWIFRPNKQFYDERERMKQLNIDAENNDYRLNANPYYFKFVSRYHKSGSPGGILMPLEHLNLILNDPTFKGNRGGTRISYNVLDGRYLRESDFLGLIHSGYIGVHSQDYEIISALIRIVLENGQNSLVFAIQKNSVQ